MLAGLLTNLATFVGELPQPYGRFEEWAIWAGRLTGTIEALPAPTEASWREWAEAFVDAPALKTFCLPAPARFAAWQDWANGARFTFSGA